MSILHLLMISVLSLQSDRDQSGLPSPMDWQMTSSCGANALFHLLAIHGEKVGFEALLRELSPPAEGNSLQELIDSAMKHGVEIQAYKCDDSGVDRLDLPFIACTEIYDMRHYILVTGKTDEQFVVWDDKSQAARSISRSKFFRMWTGFALATGITPWYDSHSVLSVAVAIEILLIIALLHRSILSRIFPIQGRTA